MVRKKPYKKNCNDCQTVFATFEKDLSKCGICRTKVIETTDERLVRLRDETIHPILKNKNSYLSF